jgi:hypothetical protein
VGEWAAIQVKVVALLIGVLLGGILVIAYASYDTLRNMEYA